METLFPIVVFLIFFVGALTLITWHQRSMSARRTLPARDDYVAAHGSAACRHCQSAATREYGLEDQSDERRVVACTACGKDLYQYRRDGDA